MNFPSLALGLDAMPSVYCILTSVGGREMVGGVVETCVVL